MGVAMSMVQDTAYDETYGDETEPEPMEGLVYYNVGSEM